MGNIIKTKIDILISEGLTLKWLVLGIFIFFFGKTEKDAIIYIALTENLQINSWDIFLAMVSNVYLILYFLFPVLLFIMISLTLKDFEHTILIRVGSYQNWIYRIQNKFLIYLIMTILVWVVTSIILSLGIPYSNNWSEASNTSKIEISSILKEFYPVPIIAAFLQILGFGIVIFLVQTLLCLLYTFLQSKRVLYVSGIALFLCGLISFKILPPALEGLSLPNYLVLYHGVSNFNSGSKSLLIILIIVLGCFFAIREFERLKNLKASFSMGLLIYMTVCSLGITYMFNMMPEENLSYSDALVFIFQGTTNQGFSYFSYLIYIIIFFGFTYFILLYLEKEMSEISYYKILRYASIQRWFWEWSKKVLVMIFCFLLLLLFFIFVVSAFQGFELSLESNIFPSLQAFNIIYHFIINGFLQITLYFLLFTIIHWCRKEDSIATIVTIGLLIVFLIPGFSFFPVGLNGFGHLLNGGSSLKTSIILISFIILQSILLYYLLNKRDFTT